jgi:hypothetical protein
MPSDAKWGLLEYQALLDVFEKDCGRPAATMAEVRYWAGAQNREHLEYRVKRRLLELLFGANIDVQPRTGARFAPPPRGWRVLRRKPKRNPSVITLCLTFAVAFLAKTLPRGGSAIDLMMPWVVDSSADCPAGEIHQRIRWGYVAHQVCHHVGLGAGPLEAYSAASWKFAPSMPA